MSMWSILTGMTLPNESLADAIDRLNREIDRIARSPWGNLLVRKLRRDMTRLENRIVEARDEGLRRYFAS